MLSKNQKDYLVDVEEENKLMQILKNILVTQQNL